MRLNPFPGYVILKPYVLNKKIGSYSMPDTESEDAPELGKVIEVGGLIEKMPFDAKYLPVVDDVVAYKKYNHFKLTLGVKKYLAVHFSNLLFSVENPEE